MPPRSQAAQTAPPAAGWKATSSSAQPHSTQRLEVREEAGQPEELELEREDERVERRPAPGLRLALVERVEEPRQGEERTVVLLLLREEPQHRLQPDEPDLEPVAVGADPVVRPHERRARDRRELTPAPVERELDVRERLEAAAEPALRPPDALRHRTEPAAAAE